MEALLKECFVLPTIVEIGVLTFLHHEKIGITICVKQFLVFLTETSIAVPTYYSHIFFYLLDDLRLL